MKLPSLYANQQTSKHLICTQNFWYKGQIGAIQLCISRALQNWDPHMRTALPAGKQDTKRIVKSGYNVLQLLSVCPVRYIVC